MQVASLELCKELYGLSLWQPVDDLPNDAATDARFWLERTHSQPVVKHQLEAGFNSWQIIVPAYDLGYLLRKLPPELSDEDNRVFLSMNISMMQNWCARYADAAGNRMNIEKFYAPTPENAACKLAIELFKQGVLATTPVTDLES